MRPTQSNLNPVNELCIVVNVGELLDMSLWLFLKSPWPKGYRKQYSSQPPMQAVAPLPLLHTPAGGKVKLKQD